MHEEIDQILSACGYQGGDDWEPTSELSRSAPFQWLTAHRRQGSISSVEYPRDRRVRYETVVHFGTSVSAITLSLATHVGSLCDQRAGLSQSPFNILHLTLLVTLM